MFCGVHSLKDEHSSVLGVSSLRSKHSPVVGWKRSSVCGKRLNHVLEEIQFERRGSTLSWGAPSLKGRHSSVLEVANMSVSG